MNDLYSYKGAYPYPLPKDLSNYMLADFVLAPDKPILAADEKLSWSGQSWVVRKANEAETVFQTIAMRNQRNLLLTNCDWTQTLDAPVNREAWSIYRQELRDITAQPGFPWNIQWPIQPN